MPCSVSQQGCARFGEIWLFFTEQVFTLPLQCYEKSNQGAQEFAPKSAKRAQPRGLYFKVQISLIVIIVNLVFPYICSFLLYLHHLILVNMKLGNSGYKRINYIRSQVKTALPKCVIFIDFLY